MTARERLAHHLAPRLRPTGAPGRALRWVHHHLPQATPERPIAQVMATFGAVNPTATFTQIGAHDGTQLDPLRDVILRRRWTGVMVEPVPYVFRRLAENYATNRRVACENAAIAEHDGTQELFFLEEREDGGVWRWYDALGSFRRDVLLSHVEQIPDIADRVVSAPVPCLTFDSLCAKHGLTRVDVVQIDTEGYDYEVVKQIDFDRFSVQLVMYENLHLDGPTRAACESLLEGAGFALLSDGMDTLALRRELLTTSPKLGQVWARAGAAA